MKKLSAMMATAAVAVLALPVAAHAGADYQPLALSDDTGDVQVWNDDAPVAYGPVDITELSGTRTDNTFKLVVKVDGFENRKYMRYLSAIGLPGNGSDFRANYLEYRVGKSGKAVAAMYSLKRSGSGDTEPVITQRSCAGFSAKANAAKSQIVFTLPVACYAARDLDYPGALVYGAVLQWGVKSWTEGPLDFRTFSDQDEDKAPRRMDNVNGSWTWSSSQGAKVKPAPFPGLP